MLEDENNFPPVAAGVPADYHPGIFGSDDSLPARTGQDALSALYSTWTFLQETDREVKDKSKLTQVIANEMTKALEKLDKSISYSSGQEKSYHDAVIKAIGTHRSSHSNEIRAVLRERKMPLSELMREATADAAVASSLYGLPGVLTGLTAADQATLNETIERTWATKDYDNRASARRVHAKLTAAKERFGSTWMKRFAAYSNTDEVKLAERLKKRGIAA